MYCLVPWKEFRSFDLNSPTLADFFQKHEVSDLIKQKLAVLEEDYLSLSWEEADKIVKELTRQFSLSETIFQELNVYLKLQQPLQAPYDEIKGFEDLALCKMASRWMIYDKKTGEEVGFLTTNGVGLFDNSTKLGYSISEHLRGRGIMAKVVSMFVTERDPKGNVFEILAANNSSVRVAEKCGFVLSGERENHYIYKK